MREVSRPIGILPGYQVDQISRHLINCLPMRIDKYKHDWEYHSLRRDTDSRARRLSSVRQHLETNVDDITNLRYPSFSHK